MIDDSSDLHVILSQALPLLDSLIHQQIYQMFFESCTIVPLNIPFPTLLKYCAFTEISVDSSIDCYSGWKIDWLIALLMALCLLH